MLGANKGRQKIFSILLVLFMMLSFTGSFPVTVKADSEPPEEAVSLTATSGEPANNTSNIPVDTIPAPAPMEEEPAYSNDDIPMPKESDINKRKEMAMPVLTTISSCPLQMPEILFMIQMFLFNPAAFPAYRGVLPVRMP